MLENHFISTLNDESQHNVTSLWNCMQSLLIFISLLYIEWLCWAKAVEFGSVHMLVYLNDEKS